MEFGVKKECGVGRGSQEEWKRAVLRDKASEVKWHARALSDLLGHSRHRARTRFDLLCIVPFHCALYRMGVTYIVLCWTLQHVGHDIYTVKKHQIQLKYRHLFQLLEESIHLSSSGCTCVTHPGQQDACKKNQGFN